MAALPVRPPVWPPAPANAAASPGASAPGRADARLSAQKAFFEAALAGKVPPSAPAADAPRASAAQAVRAATQIEADTAADKLPRPGSLIDIWV